MLVVLFRPVLGSLDEVTSGPVGPIGRRFEGGRKPVFVDPGFDLGKDSRTAFFFNTFHDTNTPVSTLAMQDPRFARDARGAEGDDNACVISPDSFHF
jgi:hypothetical protein